MKLLTNKPVSRAPARHRVRLMVGVAAITAALTGGPTLAADPVGDWLTKDGEAVIRILATRGLDLPDVD